MIWLNNNSSYKSVYASICLLISGVVSYFAGYDYRLTILNHTETAFAAYGELLIAIVLSISGLIVLICKDIRIHPSVCIILMVFQVWGYFFCKMYETTTHVAIIKWFSLLVAPFTLLLWEPKANNSDDGKIKFHSQSIIKQMAIVLIGIVSILLGIIAIYQSGVLFAEKIHNNNMKISLMYLGIGILMFFSGVLILFFRNKKVSRFYLFPIFVSLIVTIVYLLFLGAVCIPALLFYTLVMLAFSIVFLFIVIAETQGKSKG